MPPLAEAASQMGNRAHLPYSALSPTSCTSDRFDLVPAVRPLLLQRQSGISAAVAADANAFRVQIRPPMLANRACIVFKQRTHMATRTVLQRSASSLSGVLRFTVTTLPETDKLLLCRRNLRACKPDENSAILLSLYVSRANTFDGSKRKRSRYAPVLVEIFCRDGKTSRWLLLLERHAAALKNAAQLWMQWEATD